ncbi:putative uncharacterized protein DDB_G0282133 [Daktulosphaira vitifoliae]|uniref:putative uncharacterized protein DDB_G0282133 n=1 Tax=Daktulosphaira vitifoliae TaxID=58002 RepID=UPI0021AAAEA3|nr:putative uncharacterized protein DDB_G0282133 [Daktulosphaira vitifoliae]XP_050541608.1 putative uncharacterized protein DDB_G0282133 [Daktulosphaira vitifoliae]
MASNTSQIGFVKTYGKPRRTQLLSETAIWNDDLVDDFDKCLGVEHDQQTIFLSPEPSGFESFYKPKKQNDKIDKMKTIDGWSSRLQSTLNSKKGLSTVKKRNQYSNSLENKYKKYKLYGSAEKKRKLYHSSNNSLNLELTQNTCSHLQKKLKKKFKIPKNQCSTPLQKPLHLVNKNTTILMSTDKKKEMKSIKNLSIPTYDISCSPELFKKRDYSACSPAILLKKSYKKSHFDESIQISDWHGLLRINNKENFNSKLNLTYEAVTSNQNCYILPKTNKINSKNKKNKKNASNIKRDTSSDWFHKVMNTLNSDFDSKPNLQDTSYSSDLKLSPKLNITPNNILTPSNIINKKVNEKNNSPGTSLSPQCIISNIYTKINSSKIIQTPSEKKIHIDSDKEEVDCSSHDGLNVENLSKYLENSLNISYSLLISNDIFSKNYSLDDSPKSNGDITVLDKFHNSVEELIECTELKSNLFIEKKNDSTVSYDDNQVLDLNSLDKSNKNNNLLNVSSIPYKSCDLDSTRLNSDLKSYLSTNSNVTVSSISKISNDNDCFNTSNVLLQHNTSVLLNSSQSARISSFKNNVSINSSRSSFHSSSSEQNTIIEKNELIDQILKSVVQREDHQDLSFLTLPILKNNQQSLDVDNETLSINDLSQNRIYTKENTQHKSLSQNLSNSCNTSNNIFQNNNQITSSYNLEISPFYNDKPKKLSRQSSRFFNVNERRLDNFSSNCNNQKSNNNDINTSYSLWEEECHNFSSNINQNISRHKRYAGRYQNNFNMLSIKESLTEDTNNQTLNEKYLDNSQPICSQQNLPNFRLEPGKKWRRSILIMRSFIDGSIDHTNHFTQNRNKGRNWNSTVDNVLHRQSIDSSIYEIISQNSIMRSSMCQFSQIHSQFNSTGIQEDYASEYIFNKCGQSEPIVFEDWIYSKGRKMWKKIGEGVYGEVFSYSANRKIIVVKIIPIQGDTLINGENQKKMNEVYSEILIATELNKLYENSRNHTKTFCKLNSISCVKGKYPQQLLSLWKKYDNAKGSDNDCPSILPDNQNYIVLEMEDGGIDLESFLFTSANQALHAILQVLFALAVAENEYNFEHRDLHIGNILIKKISTKKQMYRLNEIEYSLQTSGIKASIIDFTLSRITYSGKQIYNNLSSDPELFTSYGDYQFEIYRMMKEETNEEWSSFKPKTNIYWMHYVLDKLLVSENYKNTNTNIHKRGKLCLQQLKENILSFDSVQKFVESHFIQNIVN